MCPAAATETMQLTDCSPSGCRLEVKFEDEWGSVCSRGFNEITGEQVCKMLGFHRGGMVMPNKGGGSNMVWLFNVKCSGKEGDIGDCKHAPWGANDCSHGEDVGLCCWGLDTGAKGIRTGPSFFKRCPAAESPESEEDEEEEEEDAMEDNQEEAGDAKLKPPKPAKNQMRLVDCSRFACRLEIKHDDKWGTVCEKGFSDGSAVAICKSLGFAEGGTGKTGCAFQTKYGNCQDNKNGEGPIWLSHLDCFGFERDLDGCQHLPWGNAPCFHNEDIGVCCEGRQGKVPTYKINKSGRVKWALTSAKGLQAPASGGPPLYTPWGMGRFHPLNGYHFDHGKGIALDQGKNANPFAYTIYLHVRFNRVDGCVPANLSCAVCLCLRIALYSWRASLPALGGLLSSTSSIVVSMRLRAVAVSVGHGPLCLSCSRFGDWLRQVEEADFVARLGLQRALRQLLPADLARLRYRVHRAHLHQALVPYHPLARPQRCCQALPQRLPLRRRQA
jgi:hypothetical protein